MKTQRTRQHRNPFVPAFGPLVAGAFLATGSASAVGVAVMEHTTLSAFSGKISDGARTLEYSRKHLGSTDYLNQMDFASGSSAGGFLMAMGGATGPGTDLVLFGWQSPSPLGFSSIIGGGSFQATFASAVVFEDFGANFGYSGTTFRIGQAVLADGTVLGAGTYLFQWTTSHAGDPKSDFIAGATFTATAPPMGAPVPLPGAAAVAATGLVLGRLGRRRR